MRRFLWLTLAMVLGLFLATGLVYLSNPFSLRTRILGKALLSSVSSVRSAAQATLLRGDPDEAAEVFVDALKDAGGGRLYEESYWRFVLLPPDVAGKLETMLDDPDPLRAAAVADGVAVLAHENRDHDFSAVVPALLRALQGKNCTLSNSAACGISLIDPGNGDMVSAVLRAAREGCPRVVYHLQRMDLSREDLGELLGWLDHEDPMLRRIVAHVLGALTKHKNWVTPSLIAILGDPDDDVVGEALSSLERLGHCDGETVWNVSALLQREDLRWGAIGFLAGNTASCPEALAAVRVGLRDGSQVAAFLDHLGSSDTLSPDLISDLLEICRSGSDLERRLKALDILAGMGPAARSAIPALEDILAKGDDTGFHPAARVALESMKGEE